jgi:hypothetical protein
MMEGRGWRVEGGVERGGGWREEGEGGKMDISINSPFFKEINAKVPN